MAEQATAKQVINAAPVIVINHTRGIRQYATAYRGDLPDGSAGTLHNVTRLLPGANRIEAGRWKELAKECEPDIKKETLSIMDKAISAYPERDALEIVKITIDRPLLQAFRSVDSREKVRTAIDKQLRDIMGKAREEDRQPGMREAGFNE